MCSVDYAKHPPSSCKLGARQSVPMLAVNQTPGSSHPKGFPWAERSYAAVCPSLAAAVMLRYEPNHGLGSRSLRVDCEGESDLGNTGSTTHPYCTSLANLVKMYCALAVGVSLGTWDISIKRRIKGPHAEGTCTLMV